MKNNKKRIRTRSVRLGINS